MLHKMFISAFVEHAMFHVNVWGFPTCWGRKWCKKHGVEVMVRENKARVREKHVMEEHIEVEMKGGWSIRVLERHTHQIVISHFHVLILRGIQKPYRQ